MSWLKLNDSLSSLKGQITSFAQEVLTEGIINDDNDPIQKLETADKKIEELTNLCKSQDNEITTLRKQLIEIHEQKTVSATTTTTTTATNTKQTPSSSSGHNANSVEDFSWFWVQENNTNATNTSSSASQRGPESISKSDSSGDLTDIQLIDTSLASGQTKTASPLFEQKEHFQQLINEKESTIKRLSLNNSLLKEKLMQIDVENRDIEELDRQHNSAIEELMSIKNEIQLAYETLKGDHNVHIEHCKRTTDNYVQTITELNVKNETMEKAIADLNNKCEIIETNRVAECAQLATIGENQLADVANWQTKHNELRTQLKLIDDEKQSLENNLIELRQQLAESKSIVSGDDQINVIVLDTIENEVKQSIKLHEICDNESELKRILQTNFVCLEKLTDYKQFCVRAENELQSLKNDEQCLVDLNKLMMSCDKQIDCGNRDGAVDRLSLIESIKRMTESFWKVDTLEKKLIELSREVNATEAKNATLAHQLDTLKADLMHYEIECGNLAKNNELLIAELDEWKLRKLETISENNEESLMALEQKLEQVVILNQQLEAECDNLRCHVSQLESSNALLEESEVELREELVSNSKALLAEIDSLKNEKSDLSFQLDELKTAELEKGKYDEHLLQINQMYAQIAPQLDTSFGKRRQEVDLLLAAIEEIKPELVGQVGEKYFNDTIKTIKAELSAIEQHTISVSGENVELKANLATTLVQVNATVAAEDVVKKMQVECAALKKELEIIQPQLVELEGEKQNLMSFIQTKHNENVQYHAEIQRLNQIIQETIDKTKDFDRIQTELNEMRNRPAQDLTEIEKLRDQITCLREKSDILSNSLIVEQNNQKLANQEKNELIEHNCNLNKDLERLRKHLIEIEEAHMQETIELQKIISGTKIQLSNVEDEVRKSSNAYTSASIRANQQTETLQAQYAVICQQKDDLSTKLSGVEDREQKNQVALINLQCALEQFQKDKNRDIDYATLQLRKQLAAEETRHQRLNDEIRSLQECLDESKRGLLAAARLSHQLEMSQATVNQLRDELTVFEKKHAALEQKYANAESNQSDKVEKSLVRNLVVGYVGAHTGGDKSQILRLMSAVLDFSAAESEKVGLMKVGGGGTRTASGRGDAGSNGNEESLAQAFVKFLEKESQPRDDHGPGLLSAVSRTPRRLSSSNAVQSPVVQPLQQAPASANFVQPILIPDTGMQTFLPPRNSSSILKDILSDI